MKLYILYIPKERSGKALPYIVRKFINEMFNETGRKVNVYLSPGYLGTLPNTRRELTGTVFNPSDTGQIAVLKTMNNNKREDYLNELSAMGFSVCRKQIFPGQDHRKMMVYYSENRDDKQTLGVLIGSSNFSKTTYLCDNKDEADVLLFQSVRFMEILQEELKENKGKSDGIFLSESITEVSPDYLNDIRQDVEKLMKD